MRTTKEKFEYVRETIMFKPAGKYFVRKGNYLVDKRMVWTFMIVVILMTAYVVYDAGGLTKNRVYISCPEDSPEWCKNPLYGNYSMNTIMNMNSENYNDLKLKPEDEYLRNIERIEPGTVIGQEPSGLFKLFPSLILLFAFVLFVLNTLIHNRKVIQAWREYEFVQKPGKEN